MDLVPSELRLGADVDKTSSLSISTLGGVMRLVVADKKTRKWVLSFLMNPADTMVFRNMFAQLPAIEPTKKISYAITEYKEGKHQQIGVIRLGKNDKGFPYLRIEGLARGTNEKLNKVFPISMYQTLSPMENAPDYPNLISDVVISWIDNDLPIARALHNQPRENKGGQPRNNKANPQGAAAAPAAAQDVDDVPF
jgi:hypothetical protein